LVHDLGSVVIGHADTVAQIIRASITDIAEGDANAVLGCLFSRVLVSHELGEELLFIDAVIVLIILEEGVDGPASTEDYTR
jgi:hypothetical protein